MRLKLKSVRPWIVTLTVSCLVVAACAADKDAAQPPIVTPAPPDDPTAPPSDAIVLFDGEDLSK